MAIYKCKMCGGELILTPGSSVSTCEYCGTKQTVPNADDEKKLTLYARANRILRGCEFDKAAGVFESIVADFPQEAEAYWGLVLCKFGIEYVDDPATGRKVPTCHRSSFDSVQDDANYQQAVKNADTVAKDVYIAEAAQIEALRREIIAVSSRTEPYDVFICYKETDERDGRTEDSVLAQEVYDALTEKGYRVFFSRITLESMLGSAYEPRIFAALNSAKIMLAFGTSSERFEAVWVRNEWSRFLQLIAKGEKKTLIPCYKGMKPEQMPKEFAHLQAQDMGKLGAVQDLLRGVEKILPLERKPVETKPQPEVKKPQSRLLAPIFAAVAVIAIALAIILPMRARRAVAGTAITAETAAPVNVSHAEPQGRAETKPDEETLEPVEPIMVDFPKGSNPDYKRNGEVVYLDLDASGELTLERMRTAVPTCAIYCLQRLTEDLGSDLEPYILNSYTYTYMEDSGFDQLQGDWSNITDENANYCLLLWKWKNGTMLAGYFVGVPEKREDGGYHIPITLCEYDVENLREKYEGGNNAADTVQPISVEFPKGSNPDYARNGEIVYLDVQKGDLIFVDFVDETTKCVTCCFSKVPEDLGSDLNSYILNSYSYAYCEDTGFKSGVIGDGSCITDMNANYCLLLWDWKGGPVIRGYFVGVPEKREDGGYHLPITLCDYDVTRLRERLEAEGEPAT